MFMLVLCYHLTSNDFPDQATPVNICFPLWCGSQYCLLKWLVILPPLVDKQIQQIAGFYDSMVADRV